MLDRVWLRVREALRAIPPRAVLRAFVLTVPSWLLESVVVYGAAQALGLELSLTAAAAVTAFTILFQVIHLTPGGIGVYEASMTAALQAQGMPGGEARTLAVLTHGLKFAYAFGPGALLAVPAVTGLPSLGRIRASREDSKRAGRFEIVAARLWNVLNEGKPFTPVFVLGTLLLLGLPHLTDGGYWLRQLVALVALEPLFVVFYRYALPLRLRAALWALLAVAIVGFRAFDVAAIALVLALFFGFTVVLWGSIYYHLRIGTPWTNGLRFWRLVLENPDGMRSNFVPSLGAKCESIFGVLEQRGMRGRLAGIAHLVDSFGEETVETVTAITPNEEIDEALVARAREILERDDPELLALQTLSVDQTGHARGSYYPEYVERIEATDRLLEAFIGWRRAEGYLRRRDGDGDLRPRTGTRHRRARSPHRARAARPLHRLGRGRPAR